jgi:hypothetical protein
VYRKRSPTLKSSGTLDLDLESEANDPIVPDTMQQEKIKTNFIDQYFALLIVILETAGLFEVSFNLLHMYIH